MSLEDWFAGKRPQVQWETAIDTDVILTDVEDLEEFVDTAPSDVVDSRKYVDKWGEIWFEVGENKFRRFNDHVIYPWSRLVNPKVCSKHVCLLFSGFIIVSFFLYICTDMQCVVLADIVEGV